VNKLLGDEVSRTANNVRYNHFQGGEGLGYLWCCGIDVLFFFFKCSDAVNKISTCSVVVISDPTVCNVCVFHAAVFGEMKLFAVLVFFNYLSQT